MTTPTPDLITEVPLERMDDDGCAVERDPNTADMFEAQGAHA